MLFYYLLFFLILNGNFFQKLVIILFFLSILFVDLLTGYRAALFSTIFNIGFIFFYFRIFVTKNIISKLNKFCIFFIFISLFLASIVSALFVLKDGDEILLQSGFDIIFNRIFANADGIEYFVKFYNDRSIEPFNFILYNFGVFINPFLNFKLLNFGQTMIENIRVVDFTQGPNYILHIQSLMFLSPLFAPIFLYLVVLLYFKLRLLKTKTFTFTDMYFFGISSFSHVLFIDSEYFIFNIFIFTCGFILLSFVVLNLIKYLDIEVNL
jgi:hypothetical protein